MFTFHCWKCAASVSVADEDVGRLVECGTCGANCTVPSAGASSPASSGSKPISGGPADRTAEPRDGLSGDSDVAFPGEIRAAGILWIIIGGLVLLGFSMFLAFEFQSPAPSMTFLGRLLTIPIAGFIGGVFIYAGFQCISGNATGTLAYGIGSMILGGPLTLAGVLAVPTIFFGCAGNLEILFAGGIWLVSGAALLVPGILAIRDRGRYEAWRQSSEVT